MSERERGEANDELLAAVEHNNLEMAESALNRGADAKAPALILAAKQANLEIMALLLRSGASIHAKDEHGDFPINVSAKVGHLEGVKFLMARRSLADVGNRYFKTPLMHAAENGHLEIVEYLLSHGVTMKHQVTKLKESELTLASAEGHVDIVELLLRSGDPSKDRSDEINHALESAIDRLNVDIARRLLQHGADPNFHCKLREPSIFTAIIASRLELLRLLIEFNANVNARNIEGYTPLMVAADYKEEEAVRILINAGADVTAVRMNSDETALSIAQKRRSPNIVKLITDAIHNN